MAKLDFILDSMTPLSKDEAGNVKGGFVTHTFPKVTKGGGGTQSNYFQCGCNNYCPHR